MSIKDKAVEKAIQFLNAAGAQYEIITEDGKHFGEIVRSKPKREPSPFLKFKEEVAAMNPGETMILTCEKEQKDAMQLAASSFLASYFGKGNYITARCATGVEIMVVSSNRAAPAKPNNTEYNVTPLLARTGTTEAH